MPPKFFDKTGKPVDEPLMLTETKEWPFDKVDIKKLRGWPKFADESPDVREKKLRKTFLTSAEKNLLKEFKAGVAANMPMDTLAPEDEYTLLQSAVHSGATDVVNYLLEIGANPGHRSGAQGYDALCVAASAGQYGMAKQLLKYAKKDKTEGAEAESSPQSSSSSSSTSTTATEPPEASKLLLLSQSKIDPETTDMFGQSILQIAISDHRFEFAEKWIEEQKPNLQHVDKFGRNALATTLGIYFRKHFNTLESDDPKELKENLLKLEKFCMSMLSKINAFEKPDTPHGLVPIQIVLHTHLALNTEPGKQRPKTAISSKAVKRIYLNALEVAKELYRQAKLSGVDGAGKYMELFDKFDIEFKDTQKYVAKSQAASSTGK